MFSWLGTDDRRRKDPEVFQTVSEGLKKLYKTKLLPLEEHYKFHEFHSPALEDADFDNKPMVLLVGRPGHRWALPTPAFALHRSRCPNCERNKSTAQRLS